jgi:hypothetical protein
MGRFLIPDWSAKEEPVPYAKLDDPQSLNLYAYVENNPLFRTDPDGHDWWQNVKDFMDGASGAYMSDEGAGRTAPDIPSSGSGTAGAYLGHALALTQSGLELTVGTSAAIGGTGEAATTSPAAVTGVGAVVPAAGVGVAVAGVAVDVHGAVTGIRAAKNIVAMATKKPSSAGRMQKEVERGRAPKSVDRVDKGRGPNEQDHVHFADRSARNQDGSWKHGFSDLSKQVTDWLAKHGWN